MLFSSIQKQRKGRDDADGVQGKEDHPAGARDSDPFQLFNDEIGAAAAYAEKDTAGFILQREALIKLVDGQRVRAGAAGEVWGVVASQAILIVHDPNSSLKK
ncbi:MAG: hypothetical protein AB1585_01710 [Thermodesulfobacteriota bacterium]